VINLTYLDSRQINQALPNGKTIKIWKTEDKNLIALGVVATTFETALVTRAYLMHYGIFKERSSLDKARDGLMFLKYMQAPNGCFYNYMKADGTADMESEASRATLDAHTAEAFRTMGEACRILKAPEPTFYNKVEDSFLRAFANVKKWTDERSDKHKSFEKMEIPAWLILDRGDLSSVYLLGLSSFYEATKHREVEKTAKLLGQGIIEFKNIEPDIFPNFAHLTFADKPNVWKTEGAFQVGSLASAGKTFDRGLWLAEAERDGTGFLIHLPASYGPIDGYYPHPDTFPQTPFAAYTLTGNFAALARATGDEIFYQVAGLCAAWFFENNPEKTPVYSVRDGSCYAGITKAGINPSRSLSGSACALLSLMEVYNTNGFKNIYFRPEYTHSYTVLESEEGTAVNTDFEISDWEYSHGGKGKAVIIRHRNTFWHKFNVDVEDDYFLLLSFQKQQMFSSSVAVNVRIDGGEILLVPLGGATADPFMMMKKVTEPVRLLPGLHTVGIRYKGLLFTVPAVIDCAILQPVLERKQFVNNKGEHLLLVKNWGSGKKPMPLSDSVLSANLSAQVRSLEGKNISEPIIEQKGKKVLMVPTQGFGIIRW